MKLSVFLFTLVAITFNVTLSDAQTLVLPGMASLSTGTGQCSNIKIGIRSERWRVRKGRTFEVSSYNPFQELSGLRYHWTVENGKILSGQSTNRITVKARGKKTSGYLNASGFVFVNLVVVPDLPSPDCSVNAKTSVMVGKYGEMNQFSTVESISLDRHTVPVKCKHSATPLVESAESLYLVKVSTVANDPESDVLTYSYVATVGNIIGEGAEVFWDISDVAPGKHTIWVGTDDGNGIHSVKAATLIIQPCES